MKMEQLAVEVVAPAGHILAETAVWCHRTQRLWWVDIRAQQVKRLDVGTGTIAVWPMPELAGAVVPMHDGRMAVALRSALHSLDPRNGSLAALLTVEADMPDNRLNEAKCDRQGRLWCGSMWDFGVRTAGSLYRIGPSLQAEKMRTGITIPNGLGFSPDGRQMFFTDTATGSIEAAHYDIATGSPGAWHTLVYAGVAPGKPDGATVDSDGCIWSTRFGAGCLARFTPTGRLDRLVALPVSQPTSCTFGGPDLRTLFVTSATQRMAPEALAAEPLAGAVLALRPGVQGVPEPPFRCHATATPPPQTTT